MMDIDLVTPPTADAELAIVSVTDMRRHMRISATTRDDLITSVIKDAVAELHGPGGELRRSVLPCTWKLWLPSFPDDDSNIEIPLPPLATLDSIGYLDTTGTPQVVSSSLYAVMTGKLCGEAGLINGQSWPDTYQHPRAVWLTFHAGYDWTGSHPHLRQIQRLVKLLAAHLYENAEATLIEGRITSASKKMELGFNFIADRLRVPLRYD